MELSALFLLVYCIESYLRKTYQLLLSALLLRRPIAPSVPTFSQREPDPPGKFFLIPLPSKILFGLRLRLVSLQAKIPYLRDAVLILKE